jgi:hypothetical protein
LVQQHAVIEALGFSPPWHGRSLFPESRIDQDMMYSERNVLNFNTNHSDKILLNGRQFKGSPSSGEPLEVLKNDK